MYHGNISGLLSPIWTQIPRHKDRQKHKWFRSIFGGCTITLLSTVRIHFISIIECLNCTVLKIMQRHIPNVQRIKIGKFYHFLGPYFLAVWFACSDSWLCHCWSDHFLSTCPPGSGVCRIVAVTLPWTRLVCCVASRLLGKFLPNSTSNSNWICSSRSDSQTEVTLLGLRQRNQEIQFVISRISMRTGS